MDDPGSIIGTVSDVANLVDAVAKNVSILRRPQDQWKEAGYILVNLMARLTALRVELDNIREWINVGMVEAHHQLVMDLEDVMACCRMLLSKLQFHVAQLHQIPDQKHDFDSKIKYMIKKGTLVEFQKMIERQTIALTLLLTACNCKAVSEQKILLEQKSSRKILQRVRDDSSSLFRQRDSTSFYSRWTGTVSPTFKISHVFDFDGKLSISKLYDKALEISLKNAVENARRQILRIRPLNDLEQKRRSQNIDKQLRVDLYSSRREIKVLLLGDRECKSIVMRQMRIAHEPGYMDKESTIYRTAVASIVQEILVFMVSVIESGEVDLTESAKTYADVLSEEAEKSRANNINVSNNVLTLRAAAAAQGLWAHTEFQSILSRLDTTIPNSNSYFIAELHRIAQEDYIPSESDIFRASARSAGIHELRFDIGSLTFNLFEIAEQRSKQEKWSHYFQHVPSFIYCVDLASYDQILLEDPSQTRLIESISRFDSVVNSPWIGDRSSMFLFFCNVGTFRQKLADSPLSNFFPDYAGGNDVNLAAEYIVGRFTQVNRCHSRCYSQLVESGDASETFRRIVSAILDTINLHISLL